MHSGFLSMLTIFFLIFYTHFLGVVATFHHSRHSCFVARWKKKYAIRLPCNSRRFPGDLGAIPVLRNQLGVPKAMDVTTTAYDTTSNCDLIMYSDMDLVTTKKETRKLTSAIRKKIAQSRKGRKHGNLLSVCNEKNITFASKNRNREAKKQGGAYGFMHTEELLSLTDQLLASVPVGFMNSTILHEVTRLLHSWAKREDVESGLISEKLLMRLLEEKQARNEAAGKFINTVIYNSVISAWVKNGGREGIQNAAKILDMMEMQYNESITNTRPNTLIYNNVLDALSKTKKRRSAEKAYGILMKMEQHDNEDARPDLHSYRAVVNCWMQTGEAIAGEKAEQILFHMYNNTQNNNSTSQILPDLKLYNMVIKCWTNSRCIGKKAVWRAEKLLNDLMQHDEIRPDKISFTTVLRAFAIRGNKRAWHKAEEILGRMEQLYQEGNVEVKPDTVTYNVILDIYSKSKQKVTAQKAKLLLEKMLHLYRKGDTDVKPDTTSMNSVINAYANDAPKKFLETEKILDEMESQGDESTRPNIITYNSVLKVYAKSKDPSAPLKAESILKKLEAMAIIKNADVTPDTVTYNSVIHCWANSKNDMAAQKAEAVLHRMIDASNSGKSPKVKPDIYSFNGVLDAYAKALPQNNEVENAAKLFELISTRNIDGNNIDIKPDIRSYCALMNTYARSEMIGKARKVLNLLRRIEALYKDGDEELKPNIYAYTAVLNACSLTSGDNEDKIDAYNIAVKVLQELYKSPYASPNHVAYGIFFKACSVLMSKKDHEQKKNYDSLIENTFRKCCRDGQVGPMVLFQMRYAASHAMYTKLIWENIEEAQGYYATIIDIPLIWKRNIYK